LIGFFLLGKAQTRVIFYTNMGNFVVTLNDSLAPITAGNFKKLVEEKFYDGILFHRVIDSFMIQGGDPKGDGTGGPGYTIQDEFHLDLSNTQGTISMANKGPNTGGSQFFINLVDNPHLDFNKIPFTSKHAVFGEVTLGFDVVQEIGKVQTGAGDKPILDVVMDSVRILILHADPPIFVESTLLAPNPITERALLYYQSADSGFINLKCYNMMGQEVWTMNVLVSTGVNTIKLDGLYESCSTNGTFALIIEQKMSLKFVRKS
jgi:cyclophilin family peptidyl-prolyl cis-trans isomerase